MPLVVDRCSRLNWVITVDSMGGSSRIYETQLSENVEAELREVERECGAIHEECISYSYKKSREVISMIVT